MIMIKVNDQMYTIDKVVIEAAESGGRIVVEGMGYKLEAEMEMVLPDPDKNSGTSEVTIRGRTTRPDGRGLAFTSSSTSKVEIEEF